MAWLILIALFVVIIAALWYGSRSKPDGRDDGSWKKYIGGPGGP